MLFCSCPPLWGQNYHTPLWGKEARLECLPALRLGKAEEKEEKDEK